MIREHPLRTRIEQIVWGEAIGQLPPWRAGAVWLLRLVYALGRDLTQGNLSLHAMSLVYTTLLSLVPLLAVSFSVLKGFGVHNQIEPLLRSALAPLGASGHEVTTRLIELVDRMQVGVLGSVGLAMLLFTVILLIQKIEQAFNYAWRVTDLRPLGQRFTQYLSVLMIGPVLFFSALGVSASLGSNRFVQSVMHIAPMGALMELASLLAPYLMISITFAFVYMFAPNTRVRIGSAIVGALIAGLLWELVGEVFGTFIAGSTRYMAIYSSLAILLLFMIWVYFGWLILLLGASVAFYHQNPELLASKTRDIRLSPRQQVRLTLGIALRIARRHLNGGPPYPDTELARELQLPPQCIRQGLGLLEGAGYLARVAGAESSRYVLARAPEGIGIQDIIGRLWSRDESQSGYRGPPTDAAIEHLETLIETACADALRGISLRDMAEGLDEASRPSEAKTERESSK